MFRFLLTKQWLALTAACILLLPSFYELSQWQWRRLDQRREFNNAILINQAKTPTDLSSILESDQTSVLPDSQWRTITLTGQWDTQNEVLVRRKSLNTRVGFWVATPFNTGTTTLIVVRGWHEAGVNSKDTPAIAAPPTTESVISVRMRNVTARTRTAPTDLPANQVDALIPNEITQGNVVSNAYGELMSCSPECHDGLVLLSPPTVSEGPHQSYALQWMFFMVLTVLGWIILVRNTAKLGSDEQ